MAIEEVEAWNAKQFERRKVRAFQNTNVRLLLYQIRSTTRTYWEVTIHRDRRVCFHEFNDESLQSIQG